MVLVIWIWWFWYLIKMSCNFSTLKITSMIMSFSVGTNDNLTFIQHLRCFAVFDIRLFSSFWWHFLHALHQLCIQPITEQRTFLHYQKRCVINYSTDDIVIWLFEFWNYIAKMQQFSLCIQILITQKVFS